MAVGCDEWLGRCRLALVPYLLRCRNIADCLKLFLKGNDGILAIDLAFVPAVVCVCRLEFVIENCHIKNVQLIFLGAGFAR